MTILRKVRFQSDEDKRSLIQQIYRHKLVEKLQAKKNGQCFKMELVIEEIVSHRKRKNEVDYLVRTNCENYLWIPESYVASSEALTLYYESQKAKRRKISASDN